MPAADPLPAPANAGAAAEHRRLERDLGVGLALDDFGTGYASLAMLRRLPLTVLKLDRSLVHALPREPEDAAIARALVQAGHAMGLCVVAAGIETPAQRDFLLGIGCNAGQGPLFARPLPPAQLSQMPAFRDPASGPAAAA